MAAKQEVLFIQGGGKGVHDEWDVKLVASLRRELGQAYEIRYPRMPNEDDPDYASWKPALERELRALPDGAIIVGHSLGGTLLAKLLSQQPSAAKLGAIVLIAPPFVGDGGWSNDRLQFPADLGARLPQGVPIHVFHGLADDVVPPAHADLYARAIPQARIHRVQGRDHQFNDQLNDVAEVIRSLPSSG